MKNQKVQERKKKFLKLKNKYKSNNFIFKVIKMSSIWIR